MKPEEIIYNSVLELDPNYSTTLNDFSVSIYNNRELLEGLSEDLYNTSTPELDKAIDDIRSTYATDQGQGGGKLDKRVVAYSPSQNQRTVYEYQEVEQLLGTPGYNYDTVEDYVGAQNATSGQKWTIEDPNLATQLEEFEVAIDQPEVDAAKQRKEERTDRVIVAGLCCRGVGIGLDGRCDVVHHAAAVEHRVAPAGPAREWHLSWDVGTRHY